MVGHEMGDISQRLIYLSWHIYNAWHFLAQRPIISPLNRARGVTSEEGKFHHSHSPYLWDTPITPSCKVHKARFPIS
jgi:hypothetical protein